MAHPRDSSPYVRQEHMLACVWETFVSKMKFNLIPHSIDIKFHSSLEMGCWCEEVSSDETP